MLNRIRKIDVSGGRTAQAVQFLKNFTQRPEILAEFAAPTAAELRAHAAATGTPLGGMLAPAAAPSVRAPAAPAVQAPAAPGTPRMIRKADGSMVPSANWPRAPKQEPEQGPRPWSKPS